MCRAENLFYKASSTFESRRLLPELDMKSQPTQEDFQDDRDPRGNNDYIQVSQNTLGIFVSVNKLWCRSSCKDVR